MEQSQRPVWWEKVTDSNQRFQVFEFFKIETTVKAEDVETLLTIFDAGSPDEQRTAASILIRMLRGRSPIILPLAPKIAERMLSALNSYSYPEQPQARLAMSILIAADIESASRFLKSFDIRDPLPRDCRNVVVEHLKNIPTDTGARKLEELLKAENDQGLRALTPSRSLRYRSIEELGRLWQSSHKSEILIELYNKWITNVYEGYPMNLVKEVLGEPQTAGEHDAYYIADDNMAIYLEINDAGEIGGRKLND